MYILLIIHLGIQERKIKSINKAVFITALFIEKENMKDNIWDIMYAKCMQIKGGIAESSFLQAFSKV